MKFSCTQENLNHGLQLVSHIASRATTLPILNNVLLQAEPGRVQLVATNLELGVKCVVRGKVETPGSFTTNSKLLADYISLLPNERVDMTLEGTALHVATPGTKTTLRGLPAEEFPLIPAVKSDRSITIPGGALKTAINRTLFAAAADEARPEISGVLLTASGKTLTLAATDSYRLAEQTITLPEEGAEMRVILPRRSLQEIVRVLGDSPVRISIDENQALFVFDDIELTTRLIEGQYPEYQSIIPNTFSGTLEVGREELITAVRQASLFGKQGMYDVTLAFDGEATLAVRAANSQAGEHENTLPVKGTGEPLAILFNFRYLLDGLTSMTSDSVTLEYGTVTSPVLIRPKGAAGDKTQNNSLYLVMPIRQ